MFGIPFITSVAILVVVFAHDDVYDAFDDVHRYQESLSFGESTTETDHVTADDENSSAELSWKVSNQTDEESKSTDQQEETEEAPNKIIGGSAASRGQFPFQAGLFIPNNRGSSASLCGGSLITSRHILTAAHCIYSKQESAGKTTVYLNTLQNPFSNTDSSAVMRKVSSFIIHPSYNNQNLDNDIAIFTLASPVNNINPVSFPSSSTYEGQTATAVGWGRTDPNQSSTSNVLLYARLTIITNKECSEKYSKTVPSTQICASYPNKDACQGDSGGPLLVGRVQVGIVSYGIGCADRRYPGVYTRVSSFLPWIRSVANYGDTTVGTTTTSKPVPGGPSTTSAPLKPAPSRPLLSFIQNLFSVFLSFFGR